MDRELITHNGKRMDGRDVADMLYGQPTDSGKPPNDYEEYKKWLRKQNLSPEEYQRRIHKFCEERGI